MAWPTIGGPPTLPKGVAQALAGGPQPIRRTAFGGGTTRSTADISFEPQSAIDERVRLRAQFGRRADHLIVGQEDDSTRRSSSGSGAPPPQPTKPRRQLGDRVSPPSRRRGPAEKRTIDANAGPDPLLKLKGRLSPSSGPEGAATMRPLTSSPLDDLHGINGMALNSMGGMASSLPAGSMLPGSQLPRSAASPGRHRGAGASPGRHGGGMPGPSSAAAADASVRRRPVAGAEPRLSTEPRLSSASPVGMRRARTWSAEVEDAFRLQMAGYRDLQVPQPIPHPCDSRVRRRAGAHASEPSTAASQPPVATCLVCPWQELLLLGEPPPERWDGEGFIKKLTTRETIGATHPHPHHAPPDPMALYMSL